MKIIGGIAKGKILQVPKKGMRPTQNMLREAVFNILKDSFLKNAAVLDLFCGSGSLGIEALSRGAGKAVFIDNNKEILAFVRRNLDGLKQDITAETSLIKADAFKAIKKLYAQGKKFDLILADPPYHRDLGKKCLRALDECDILTPNALFMIEYFKKENLQTDIKNLKFLFTRQYGDTKISFFRKRD